MLVRERRRLAIWTWYRSARQVIQKAVNPYDAAGWTAEIELSTLTVPGGATVTTGQIGTPDPRRIWLLLCTVPSTAVVFVWPEQQDGPWGIAPVTGQSHILIHNASYPSLVQGGWYVFVDAPGVDVNVIQARDML